MKILIIGATGNTGIALLKMAMAEGHEVTAFVRNEKKLSSMLDGASASGFDVVVGDIFDRGAVELACKDQSAVINAAGNVTDGSQFIELLDLVTTAVENSLGENGRFWFFGGAAALDVPGTDIMTTNLPKVPELFGAHRQNYQRVSATTLNWSMLCPGPMISSPTGAPHNDLRVAKDSWPTPLPAVMRYLPRIATSLAFKLAMPQLTICYEDAARIILDNLGPDSSLARKRVGVALPVGLTQKKEDSLVPA